MENFETRLEEEFPELLEARSYIRHKKYSSALELFVQILEEVDESSEEYFYLLLEYTQCIIENIFFETEMNYRKILQTRNPIEENEIEEDLENAWECLELCRLSFEQLSNGKKLAEVYKGLGDVQSLKNCFKEAVDEYKKALSYCEDDLSLIEIYECIAECYRNDNQFEKSIENMKNIIQICKSRGMDSEAARWQDTINGYLTLQSEFHSELPEAKVKLETIDSDDAININHLKR